MEHHVRCRRETNGQNSNKNWKIATGNKQPFFSISAQSTKLWTFRGKRQNHEMFHIAILLLVTQVHPYLKIIELTHWVLIIHITVHTDLLLKVIYTQKSLEAMILNLSSPQLTEPRTFPKSEVYNHIFGKFLSTFNTYFGVCPSSC